MFGRRDRCLLVLSQLAGVPYQHLATLTAGDVTVAAGAATITAAGQTRTVEAVRRSGAVRAVRDHPLAADPRRDRHQDRHPRGLDAPRKAESLTSESPHVCRGTARARRPVGRPPAAGAGQPVGTRPVPADPDVTARGVPAGPGPAGRDHHGAPGPGRSSHGRRAGAAHSPTRSRQHRLHETAGAGGVGTAARPTSPSWPASPTNSPTSTGRPPRSTSGSTSS